jgi:hypothetical protein
LQVLPPLLCLIGTERPVCLACDEVGAEEQLSQRVVNEDLQRIDREQIQAPLSEEARQLATDPPVLGRIGVGQDNGSGRLLFPGDR